MKTNYNSLVHLQQKLFSSMRFVYQDAPSSTKMETITDEEKNLANAVGKNTKLLKEISDYQYLAQKGKINEKISVLKGTKIPDSPTEALKVLKGVNDQLEPIAKVLSEIAYYRAKDDKGNLKNIPGTDLPELKVEEVTALLNKEPADALTWLANNHERNTYISYMRSLFSDIYASKKPLLDSGEAKKYRDMEPAAALKALKEIHDKQRKAVEGKEKTTAENDLDQALNKIV